MSKKFLFRFCLGLFAVAAAVLWLLSVVAEKSFGWFSFGWAVVVVSGGFGLTFVLKGLLERNTVVVKKWSIYLGAAMLILCAVTLIGELAFTDKLVAPIIALVVTVALLLGYVAVGGKKWDQGDNQNAGYKSYYQRKEEEQQKKNEEK